MWKNKDNEQNSERREEGVLYKQRDEDKEQRFEDEYKEREHRTGELDKGSKDGKKTIRNNGNYEVRGQGTTDSPGET